MSRHVSAWASGLSFLLSRWTADLKMLALFLLGKQEREKE